MVGTAKRRRVQIPKAKGLPRGGSLPDRPLKGPVLASQARWSLPVGSDVRSAADGPVHYRSTLCWGPATANLCINLCHFCVPYRLLVRNVQAACVRGFICGSSIVDLDESLHAFRRLQSGVPRRLLF
jgi:hypothetical protein